MPPAFIRVIACDNGGGGAASARFRSWHEIVVAGCCHEDRPPVKITLKRDEVLLLTPWPPPVKMWVRRAQEGRHDYGDALPLASRGAYGRYGGAALLTRAVCRQ